MLQPLLGQIVFYVEKNVGFAPANSQIVCVYYNSCITERVSNVCKCHTNDTRLTIAPPEVGRHDSQFDHFHLNGFKIPRRQV